MSMEIPPGTDLSKIPLLPNPDGSLPNFENPETLETETYSVTIILMVASFILLALRLRTNLKLHKKFKFDDYFCIVAWILASAYNVIVITSTSTARHIWDVPLSAVDASWVKRSAVLGTIYGPAMWFAKTAILTLYLRLFKVIVWMNWCCYFGIGILFCAYWSLVPVSIIYNFPHGKNEHWDLTLTLKSVPAQVPFVVMGIISVISDVYIFVLPLPILLKLHVSTRRKIGLCLVFMTALIGIVSSCLVLYFRVVLWKNKTLDSSWNVAASYLTVVVELNVAVIVSCAPAAAASWKHVLYDSKFFSGLRSVFNSSKNSLLKIVPTSNTSKRLESPALSATNLAPPHTESIELPRFVSSQGNSFP